MFRYYISSLVLSAIAVLGLSAPATAGPILVTLDTAPLAGQTLTLGFSFFDGLPVSLGGAANTVTLGTFAFGVGGDGSAVATADCTLGGALSGTGCGGDLVGGVTLTDSAFAPTDGAAFFTQDFTVGSKLSFLLNATSHASNPPDAFAMYLCADSTLADCYSDDSGTFALLTMDLTGGPGSGPVIVVNGARLQGLRAPLVEPTNVSAVPEPTTVLLVGGGLASAALGKRRLARAKVCVAGRSGR